MTETKNTPYIEFHRKYQPETWDDFIGQDKVISQLKIDVIENRHIQGRMFEGTAGTGKTSIALVLAKALNCTGRPKDSADPCQKCEWCKTVQTAKLGAINYFNASKAGGIEIAREIVTLGTVKQALGAPFIIVDECHGLTSAAWGVFYDYLENKENTPKAPIIFCTNHNPRIDDAIKSRLQWYKFTNIRQNTLEDWLQDIADKEGITITANGIRWCAQNAGGSARMALARLEEYLRNPDDYDADESTTTALMRCMVRGELDRIGEAIDKAAETPGALRTATEEAINQLTNYVMKAGNGTVESGRLPFFDVANQEALLADMSKVFNFKLTFAVQEVFENRLKGIWNINDEVTLYASAWTRATWYACYQRRELQKQEER